MKKTHLLAAAAVGLIGCGGSSNNKTDGSTDKGDMAHVVTDDGGDKGDMATAPLTTAVSGFTIDIDLLSFNLQMTPTATPQELIGKSCVKNTPVHGVYEGGGMTATVMADDMCNYTIQAEQGKKLHLVADAFDATKVVNTYSQDMEVVGTSALPGIPAHVCTSNPYSAPVGVAAAAGIDIASLVTQGVCMYGSNDHFQAPYVKLTPSTTAVAETGFDQYGYTNPMTMPPTFVKQADSMIGIHGFTKTGLTAPTTIHITATADSGANTYAAAFGCDVQPGYVSFAPQDPNN
ncbi:MAG: hypothetical protein ABI321_04400 [Polyangia bacterium]